MLEQASQALYRLTYDEGGAFGLESFADTIILDASTAPPTICALRMGGEPEQVQTMASIIQGGGTITAELDGERQKLVCLEWAYRRQLSRSGPYTHATFVASELPITPPKQEKQEQKGAKTEQPQAMEPEQPKPEDIKSVAALCNDYDEMVSLSKETHEPILLTRNGHGEMILVPIEIWEKREAELALLTELLRREQNRLAGAPTSAMEEMRAFAIEVTHED